MIHGIRTKKKTRYNAHDRWTWAKWHVFSLFQCASVATFSVTVAKHPTLNAFILINFNFIYAGDLRYQQVAIDWNRTEWIHEDANYKLARDLSFIGIGWHFGFLFCPGLFIGAACTTNLMALFTLLQILNGTTHGMPESYVSFEFQFACTTTATRLLAHVMNCIV